MAMTFSGIDIYSASQIIQSAIMTSNENLTYVIKVNSTYQASSLTQFSIVLPECITLLDVPVLNVTYCATLNILSWNSS
jgi:hypothetical protein